MITPTKASLDAFRPEYEPHRVPTDKAAPKQRAPRWVKVLASIAFLGVVAAVIARLAR
jgi:hypothetical protein